MRNRQETCLEGCPSCPKRDSERLPVSLSALDKSKDFAYVVCSQGWIVYANPALCNLLDYTPDSLCAMAEHRLRPTNADATCTHNEVCRARYLRRDGSQVLLDVSFSPFEFEGAEYRLVLARDAVGRIHAEDGRTVFKGSAFAALAANISDPVARYGRDLRRTFANDALASLLGQPLEDLLGKRPSETKNQINTSAYEIALESVFAQGQTKEYRLSLENPENGQIYEGRILMVPEFDSAGRVDSVLGIGFDNASFDATDHRLQEIRLPHIGHWQWDISTKASEVSHAVCQMFEKPESWKPNPREAMRLIVPDDRNRLLQALRDAWQQKKSEVTFSLRVFHNGRVTHHYNHVRIMYRNNGIPRRLLGTTQNISSLLDQQAKMYEATFHDPLTNLPNRSLFKKHLLAKIQKSEALGNQFYLMFVGLDRFKEINEARGLSAGDGMLFEVAQRLNTLVQKNGIVARLGGDEFAILKRIEPNQLTPEEDAQRILGALQAPFLVDDEYIFLSASIGIAKFPQDGDDAVVLMQYADLALHEAKRLGRNCYQFYDVELSRKSKRRADIEIGLRHSDLLQQLDVYFQPQVETASGKMLSAEAFVRWNHPVFGQVPPNEFIPIAEQIGVIVEIGSWVLRRSCQVAAQMNQGRSTPFRIAVNLSPRQFRYCDLEAVVLDALSVANCRPEWLELEITEGLLLDDSEAIRSTLQNLRKVGVTIAIDDFGTGYCALSYLKRFPIDVLKIDRSFVNDIGIVKDSTELVKGIISMALSLNLGLVAEGIETPEQAEFLHQHGCRLGQGFYYSRPVPFEKFINLPNNLP